VVSLGDSFISGEGGRWAGNESLSTKDIDALGPAAYWDAGDREAIDRCHRSRSAAIHIGVVKSLNLACSGAITSTKINSDGTFKPGIDFYDQGGRKGQALLLQEFAAQNNVRMVALSIGGNDFHFADIIAACVGEFLKPFVSTMCKDSSKVQGFIAPDRVAKVRTDTSRAILNIAEAMENAGYADTEWTLVLQLYPQPLPGPATMRYTEPGYERQSVGGCGFRDGDLTWAAGTLLPLVNDTFRAAAVEAEGSRPSLQVEVMDSSRAFDQRQLCHNAVWRVKESTFLGSLKGPENWKAKGAVDLSEWVMEINIINAGDTYGQESLHPNYWGQLALRNCWRQVWNGGDVRGGVCERAAAAGLTADCEPNMTLATSRASGVRQAAVPTASAVSVTLRCPGITVDRGKAAVLRGRVSPADGAAKVRLQESRDGSDWRTIATRSVGVKGDYRFTAMVPRSAPLGRTYSWRVVATSGSRILGVSRIRTSSVR
jgi:hypothetical protein